MRRRIFFRLSGGHDPEERLEEAALWKALHDELGDLIEPLGGNGDLPPASVDAPALPRNAIVLGAPQRRFGQPVHIDKENPFPYWTDPAFLDAAGRPFWVGPIEEAGRVIDALHAAGLGAFLKSCRSKHAIFRVPVGESWRKVIGDHGYSFIDGGPHIMVQELCTVLWEWRFFVIGRKIVTHSPNAAHLTPLDWPCRGAYRTPADRKPAIFRSRDSLHGQLAAVAAQIARDMRTPNAVVDMAMIKGEPACVELNPMVPGGVGLFACDVRALARAIVRDLGLKPA